MSAGIEIAGWTGAVILLGAYALVSMRRLPGDSVTFQLMNIGGSAGVATNSGANDAWASAGAEPGLDWHRSPRAEQAARIAAPRGWPVTTTSTIWCDPTGWLHRIAIRCGRSTPGGPDARLRGRATVEDGAPAFRALNRCAAYGRAIRPGAWFAPFWVWQLLQSPVGGELAIARRAPFATTATWIGNATAAWV